ncbi:SHOCT domain-containing protein [Arthrobacter sp. NPDC058192]|uniref:SHOCT domain-containing protein n=1 Tax=Arthrobacter sp. NPDC058192 TaxID=3346372 RepID=UPI0036EE85F7
MNSNRYPASHHKDRKADREASRKSRAAEMAAYALERSLTRPDGSQTPAPSAVIGSVFGVHLRLYGDAVVVAHGFAKSNEPRERPHYLSELRELQWAISRNNRCFIRTPPAGPEIQLDIARDPFAIQCTRAELDEGLIAIRKLYPSLPLRQTAVFGELVSYMALGTTRAADDSKVQKALGFVPGFTPSNHITGINRVALGLDSVQHKFCVIDVLSWTCRIYEAADLMSVEVFEDGQSIARSHRHGKTGRRMVAAGLLVGDFGTLAAGLAAGNTAKPRDLVHEVTIRLGINDPVHPIRDVPLFVSRSSPIKRGSSWYRSLSTEARSWASLLTAMTKAADLAASETEKLAGPSDQAPGSVAAELRQLAKLYADGHLTDSEFAELKDRVING